LPLKERKELIIDAINGLGPPHSEEVPSSPNPELQEQVARWMARSRLSPEAAVLLSALQQRTGAAALTAKLLESAAAGGPLLAESAEERWLATFAHEVLRPAASTEA
jgi:hypothetical protein